MSNILNYELNQLQLQLKAIQEQQHLQKFMIKQFQQQLKSYQNKQESIYLLFVLFYFNKKQKKNVLS